MSIVNNMWLRGSKKRLGGSVLYQAMGQTRQRELAAEVRNPRTQSQMAQRVKWANLVNFYRANKSWMKFAYETKQTNQSDYNKFMSLNVANSRIYLPKSIANQGGCVVDAYVMTQGSLASIEILPAQNNWQTNVYTPGLLEGVTTYTIGEVSRAILGANPAIHEGDQLSFIRFTQQTNSVTGVPYVVVRKYEVIINSNDLRMFFDFMPDGIVDFGGAVGSEALVIKNTGNAGGFLMCLSRTVGGKTFVSTQSIIVANNSSLIEAYSSDAALQTAIDSYGESEEPFLTSTTADQDSQAAVSASILSVKIGDTIGTPGQRFVVDEIANEMNVEITFNKGIGGSIQAGTLVVYSSGVKHEIYIDPDEIAGNKFVGVTGQLAAAIENCVVESVYETIDGVDYRAVFAIRNEDTIEGLE